MKVSATASSELVTCHQCEKEVAKRDACGVGFSGRMTWVCTRCILAGGMDGVLAPIGQSIRAAVNAQGQGK